MMKSPSRHHQIEPNRTRLMVAIGCAVLAFAAPMLVSAEPPIPIDPSRTQTTVFRYGFTPNSEQRYRYDLTWDSEVLIVSPPARIQRHFEMGYDLRVLTQRLDESANGIVAHETTAPAVSIQQGDQTVSVRQLIRALDGRVRRLRVSPRGELLESSDSVDLGAIDVVSNSALLFDSGDLFELRFPETPVAIGGTWEHEYTPTALGEAGGVMRSGTEVYTFLGYAELEGRVYTVIEMDTDVWIEVNRGGTYHGLDGPALGRGVGVGYFYFNAAQGQLERAYVDFGFVMRTTEADPIEDVFVELELSLQPGAAVAPPPE